MAARKLTINDLFAVSTIQGIRLSPDGAHAVVAVRSTNVKEQRNESALWLWSADGSPFRRITKGPADSGAMWLDDKTIVFSSARRESDEEKSDKVFRKSRLYTLRIDGGEAELRATLDGALFGMQPSPRGKSLALVFCPNPPAPKEKVAVWEKAPRPVEPKRYHFRMDGMGLIPEATPGIFVLDCGGAGEWKKPRRIAHDEAYAFGAPAWTPDGKRIVAMRSESDKPFAATDIVILDMRGKAQVLNAPKGFVSAFAISPDGERLAFAANDKGAHGGAWPVPLGVRSMNPADRKWKMIAETDGRFANFDVLSDITAGGDGRNLAWRDNDRLAVLVAEHGHARVDEISVSDPKSRRTIAGGKGAVSCFDVSEDRLLYTWSDPTNLGELYANGSDAPVSKLNVKAGKPFTMSPLRWDVKTAPGIKVDTWLWMTTQQQSSRAKGSLPLVVYVHGGPNTENGDTPFHEYAWLAQQGFPVVTCNPRGSTGYGEKHGPAISGNWGDADVKDILAVRADALAKYPQLDPARTFIVGGSYGGYMANMMVTRHPGVFRAGIAERSICNHISFFGTSDFPLIFTKLSLDLDHPWQNIDRAWKMSPISQVQKVVDPLLVIHSDADYRCPLSQAEEMVMALIATGKKLGEDVKLFIFRGESHGLSRGGRPENRRVRLELILSWLKKHNSRRSKGRRVEKSKVRAR